MTASSIRSPRSFFVALVVTGLALAAAGALPVGVLAEAGSVWTTDAGCGTQDINQYAAGDSVYLRGSGFASSQVLAVTVTGQPGSGDPNIEVASTSVAADGSGDFCAFVYTVLQGDFGVYRVNVGNKNDNFTVAAPPTPTPTATSTTAATATATSVTAATATATATVTTTATATSTSTASASPTAVSTSASTFVATPTATSPAATATKPAATPTSPPQTATQAAVSALAAAPTATPPVGVSPGVATPETSPAAQEVQAFALASPPVAAVLSETSSTPPQVQVPTVAGVRVLPSAGQGGGARDFPRELLAMGLVLVVAGFSGLRTCK